LAGQAGSAGYIVTETPQERASRQAVLEQREKALLALVDGQGLKGRTIQEQSLGRALALREIAVIRFERAMLLEAEQAIERAVREAVDYADAELLQAVREDRFRLVRIIAFERAKQGDIEGGLKILDRLTLLSDLTPAQKKQLAGDRFLLIEKRPEVTAEGALAKIPGTDEFEERREALASLDKAFFTSIADVQVLTELDTTGAQTSRGNGDALNESKSRGTDRGNDRQTVDLKVEGPKRDEVLGESEVASADLPIEEGQPLIETGKLDQQQVVLMVRNNRKAVKGCYERSLRAGERLSGKLEVRMTVATNGIVLATEVITPDFVSTTLGRCVAATIKRWRFPPFEGSTQRMTVPFHLHSAY
jgi:hypothetical protein